MCFDQHVTVTKLRVFFGIEKFGLEPFYVDEQKRILNIPVIRYEVPVNGNI